jgi:hypothetical protein
MNKTQNTQSHEVLSPACEEFVPDTLRMVSPEDAARAGLGAIILTLGIDELLVLGRLAERLQKGQAQYGLLHLASDRRSFRAEALEEVLDALIYVECELARPSTREVR